MKKFKKYINIPFLFVFCIFIFGVQAQTLTITSELESELGVKQKERKIEIPKKYAGATISPYVYKLNPYMISNRVINISEKNNRKNFKFTITRIQRGFDDGIDTDTDNPYPENQNQTASLNLDTPVIDTPIIIDTNEDFSDIHIQKRDLMLSKRFRTQIPVMNSIVELTGIMFFNSFEKEAWEDSLSDGEYLYKNSYKIEQKDAEIVRISFVSSSSKLDSKNSSETTGSMGIVIKENGVNFEGEFIVDMKTNLVLNFKCKTYATNSLILSDTVTGKERSFRVTTLKNKWTK